MRKELSRKEVRDALSLLGKTAEDVARELNVDGSVVRGILSGKLRGTRGDSHKVAVSLGIKKGLIVDAGHPLAEAIKAGAGQ